MIFIFLKKIKHMELFKKIIMITIRMIKNIKLINK